MPILILAAAALTIAGFAVSLRTEAVRKERAATAQSLLGVFAGDTRIPADVRRWSSIVVPVSVENAEDAGIGAADLARLVFAHMALESGGDPNAVNRNRDASGRVISEDRGLMQINSAAHPSMTTPFDPASAVAYAVESVILPNIRFFSSADWGAALARVGASPLTAAVAAYNAGAGAVANVVRNGRHPDAATNGGRYATLVLGKARAFGFGTPVALV